jgi:hypothetical protein
MTPTPTAAQKVTSIRDQLLQAYIAKEDAETKLAAANRQIAALRNTMAGVTVGQQLQQEIEGEAKVPTAPVAA